MDKVEKSNLNRQMFYEKDVGKYKVEAMKEKLLNINPKLKIETFDCKIEEIDKKVFKNIHFVFDCLDNIKTREHIAKFCWDNKNSFHTLCLFCLSRRSSINS